MIVVGRAILLRATNLHRVKMESKNFRFKRKNENYIMFQYLFGLIIDEGTYKKKDTFLFVNNMVKL